MPCGRVERLSPPPCGRVVAVPSPFSAVAHLGHKQSEGAAAVAAELFSVFDFGFVSRVQRGGGAVVLLEDRSSNGTFLNGVRVPRFVPTRVALGDVVVLGCNGNTADTHVAVGGRCPTADPPSAVTLQLPIPILFPTPFSTHPPLSAFAFSTVTFQLRVPNIAPVPPPTHPQLSALTQLRTSLSSSR